MGGGAPNAFAADFRRIVVPVLLAEIRRIASELADDRISFGEAMAELEHLAHRRGAGYLTEPIRDQLTDWLSATLIEETELAEDAMALIRSLLREPSREVMQRAIREFLGDD